MTRCPICRDSDVHRSRWSGAAEFLLFGLLLHRPVRCYACLFRFHAWIFASTEPRRPAVRAQKAAS